MTTNNITLGTYLSQVTQAHANGGALSTVLQDIASATQEIAALTTRGMLAEITGKLESQNIQGETQVKLDVVSNDIFIAALTKSGFVASLVSEEMDEVYTIDSALGTGKFLVAFDPLDGSSNVSVNVSVGSIFSVLNAPKNHVPKEADYLQAGNQQVAAGYAIYGPATMLVLTMGEGTHGFTLDPDQQLFILTHPYMQIPETSSEFAINVSNERFWEAPVARYIDECKAGISGVRGRDFNMRWVASMVADVHRILMRGGVYLYPRDNKKPVKAGRLRLMYEANPMSMLVEQAGGGSSTGRQRMMDVMPDSIHQRVPVIIGTAQEVSLIEHYTSIFDSGDEQIGYSPLFSGNSFFHKKQSL